MDKHQIKSIAFPAISCGAYKYPVDKACEIVITEVSDFLNKTKGIEYISFVCFDSKIERRLNLSLTKIKERYER